MANVQVIQRNAHLAGSVQLEYVNGRDGQIARALLTAISNSRRGSGESRSEEATAIQWTLWGAQAENAAEFLAKGSHINVVGRLRNNNYDKEGETVYGWTFTAEELDYLDSKADGEALRAKHSPQPSGGKLGKAAKPAARGGAAWSSKPASKQSAAADDDVPF